MDFEEFFIGEGGTEVVVTGFDEVEGALKEARPELTVGGASPESVDDAFVAILAHTGAKAADLALGKIQLSGGFRPGHSSLQDVVDRF